MRPLFTSPHSQLMQSSRIARKPLTYIILYCVTFKVKNVKENGNKVEPWKLFFGANLKNIKIIVISVKKKILL
jgi:hypothetical protein